MLAQMPSVSVHDSVKAMKAVCSYEDAFNSECLHVLQR